MCVDEYVYYSHVTVVGLYTCVCVCTLGCGDLPTVNRRPRHSGSHTTPNHHAITHFYAHPN